MKTVNDALKIINNFPINRKIEKVGLFDTLGRVLAEDIQSSIDIPPFNKSAMDGYAVDKADNSKQYFIKETIPAGFDPGIEIKKGECAKIMTGAMIPKGANRVIKKEVTEERDGFMMVKDVDKMMNICLKGEDISAGDIVLKAGRYVSPQHVGLIASVGYSNVMVYKKPLVGIITTGNEIVAPGEALQPGKIYNSDSYSIGSQYLKYGCDICYEGMVIDNKQEIKKTIKDMLKTCNVVVISGGVSVGEFDYVPGVLEQLGVKIEFRKVAIKPGKPTVFGTLKEKAVFGLPGNPVSTFVINEIFVKPFLFKMMGRKLPFPFKKGVLSEEIKINKSDRTSFVPITLKNGKVKVIPYHGSAHLSALVDANGLLEIPKGASFLKEGTSIDVRSI